MTRKNGKTTHCLPVPVAPAAPRPDVGTLFAEVRELNRLVSMCLEQSNGLAGSPHAVVEDLNRQGKLLREVLLLCEHGETDYLERTVEYMLRANGLHESQGER